MIRCDPAKVLLHFRSTSFTQLLMPIDCWEILICCAPRIPKHSPSRGHTAVQNCISLKIHICRNIFLFVLLFVFVSIFLVYLVLEIIVDVPLVRQDLSNFGFCRFSAIRDFEERHHMQYITVLMISQLLGSQQT